MEYRELIDQFAEKLGGDVEITPDEDGTVMLEVDGMPLTIMGMEEVGQAALVGVVGEPPPADKMERLYKAILEANHNFAGTGGATFSINPDTGDVSLCRLIPLALADADGFFTETERFVNTLETWRKIVEDFRGAEVETSVEAKNDVPEAASEMANGIGGFMQV